MIFLAIISVQTEFVSGSKCDTSRSVWRLFQLLFHLIELRVCPRCIYNLEPLSPQVGTLVVLMHEGERGREKTEGLTGAGRALQSCEVSCQDTLQYFLHVGYLIFQRDVREVNVEAFLNAQHLLSVRKFICHSFIK